MGEGCKQLLEKPNPLLIVFLGMFTGLFAVAYEAVTALPLKNGLIVILGVSFCVVVILLFHYGVYVLVEAFQAARHAYTETPRSQMMDKARSLTAEQLAVIPRLGYGIKVGYIRNRSGDWQQCILHDGSEIPYEFVEKFIANSNDEYCWSERATSEGSEERRLYIALTNFLWANDFAELPMQGRKTKWIENGRALLAHELGIEILPDLRSTSVGERA